MSLLTIAVIALGTLAVFLFSYSEGYAAGREAGHIERDRERDAAVDRAEATQETP